MNNAIKVLGGAAVVGGLAWLAFGRKKEDDGSGEDSGTADPTVTRQVREVITDTAGAEKAKAVISMKPAEIKTLHAAFFPKVSLPRPGAIKAGDGRSGAEKASAIQAVQGRGGASSFKPEDENSGMEGMGSTHLTAREILRKHGILTSASSKPHSVIAGSMMYINKGHNEIIEIGGARKNTSFTLTGKETTLKGGIQIVETSIVADTKENVKPNVWVQKRDLKG